MKGRFSSSSMFSEVLTLVVLAVLAGQAISLVIALTAPPPETRFTLADAARALESRENIDRGGKTLRVGVAAPPPAHWNRDLGPIEPLLRLELARRLKVSTERVVVEMRDPFPGAKWLMWGRDNAPQQSHPGEAFPPEFPFDDYDAALRLENGSWLTVEPPRSLLGRFAKLVLLWLVMTLVVLVPLVYLFNKRLVRPISLLAEAAQGVGAPVEPVPVSGPRELRTAAAIFNQMQTKIESHVGQRVQLVAAIAHDLRTPLMRLRFRIESLPAGDQDPLVRDINHMDRMIGGALACLRGDGGAERVRLDLLSLLQSVVDDLADIGALVTMDPGPQAEVQGDSGALRRLLTNVLENAIKYGGEARCRVLERHPSWVVQVDDPGEGVSEAEREQVFEPYFRGAAAATDARGVGLGLAVARTIAEEHGGKIVIQNFSPGCGTRVEITLPAADLRSA